MKSMLKKTFFVLLISISLNAIKPISDTAVTGGSIGCGVGSGVGTWAILSKCELRGLLSTAAALGGGFVGYKFLLQFTPQGRLKRAIKRINKAETNIIVGKEFASKDEMFSFIKRWYVASDWPLVNVKVALDQIRSDLIKAISLLRAAASEKRIDFDFCEVCEAVSFKAKVLLDHVLGVLEDITSHQDYSAQYDRYQRYLIAQQQREQLSNFHHSDQWQRERHHRQQMNERQHNQLDKERRHNELMSRLDK